MRDALAEQLLAKVMEWSQADVAAERPRLQAIANLKYDQYQQFSPGMRFVESLALWLNQFATVHLRRVGYAFVMKRLIFCSPAEVNHLVAMSYPDEIKPLLLRKVAAESGYDERHVAKISRSQAFALRRRQCLFLGLSDGARTDVFRRANPEISNEQVLLTYEISPSRVDSLLNDLRKDIEQLEGGPRKSEQPRFRTIVLLDDFSASGISYVRPEDGELKGKVANFLKELASTTSALHQLVVHPPEIYIVLYMASIQARQHLVDAVEDIRSAYGLEYSVLVVHTLADDVRISVGDGDPVNELIDACYDADLHAQVEDEHLRKGGTSDYKYGFAACGLPLVLSHNSPNNSVLILWSYEGTKVRGLFPRVQRHKEAT